MLLHLALGAAQLPRRDLLGDEAFTVAAVHRLPETLGATSGTMAAYYVLLTPWSFVSDGPIWLSVPSLLFSAGAVALLALLVDRQWGRLAGRWAGVLAACTYVVARFSTIARSYGLFLLVVAAAWYLLDRAMDDPPDRRTWFAFGAVTASIPLVHGMGGLVIVALIVAIVTARPARIQRTALLAGGAAGLGIEATLYALGARSIGREGPLTATNLRRLVTGAPYPALRPSLLLLTIAAIGAAVCWRAGRDSPLSRLRSVALPLWAFAPPLMLVAISTARPSLVSRFVLPSTLAIAGLLAVALTSFGPPLVRRAAPAVVAAGLLVGGVGPLMVANHQWHDSVHRVIADAEPGDGIVFAPGANRLAFEAALPHDDGVPLPTLVNVGANLGTFDRFGTSDDPSTIAATGLPFHRLWLITRPIGDGRARAEETERLLLAEGRSVEGRWRYGEVVVTLLGEAARA